MDPEQIQASSRNVTDPGATYTATPDQSAMTTEKRIELLRTLRRDGTLSAREYECAVEILLHISAPN
jgi:hypothetical protein